MKSEIAKRTLKQNGLPIGKLWIALLKAVSRFRIATIKIFSCGALAIERLRVLPCEVSFGSIQQS